MKILILGNGAREETIKDILYKNNNVICECSNKEKFESIKEIINDKKIEMVIPSTEVYLCKGIKDYLEKEIGNIKVFGPTKEQAKIEGSKYYSKKIMNELNIPTSNYYFLNSYEEGKKFYNNSSVVVKETVIKYDGLAKGKGVYLPDTVEESLKAIKNLFYTNEDCGIIVERRLYGTEVSVLAFCNGKEAYLMPEAQDYKRIYDGDKGPNTGGMGAICPANILTKEELIKVKNHMDKVVKKLNYKGILYAGLMKSDDGCIYFLEFNCRFGDPEAQVILNLLDSNLLNILNDCIEGNELLIIWKDKFLDD